jgi:asparagine synthase (glutamine-hydrolysing)
LSAFACILDRSGEPLDPEELHRVAGPLAMYGGEVDTFCRGPVGIAIRHRGGAGSRDRHGPLADSGTGTVVAVAGRFRPVGDHPDPSVGPPDPPELGCAALALARVGDPSPARERDFLAGLSGSFALVVADPAGGSVRIARDHLGSHKVYYFLDDRRLVAASEASAILLHGSVSDELDEASAARFLGFRFGQTERSFFRRIRELPPAHRLHATSERVDIEQYWRFRRLPSAGGRPPGDVTAEFLDRLGRSVAGEAAGLAPERVALSLSGGLDSTAVAALAPRGIRALSWTFDDTPDADEQPHVEAVSRHLDLPVHRVAGDGLHPLCEDFAARFVHESSPYLNPFAALKHRLYEAARALGCERVLVGDGGDSLYAAREYWLRDALASGRPEALRSLAGTIRRAARGDRFARLALVRVLPVRGLRTALRRDPSPWLTATARAALPQQASSPILPPGRRRARYDLAAGARHTEIESEERRLFARCGVERGNPFWSWPLLETALRLPATWYHRDGRSKILTREALRGRLPARILDGERRGSLESFFLRGIEQRRDDLRETVFRRPLSDWPRYVRSEWLEPYLAATRSIAFGHTILWRVISYELWTRRLAGRL